MMQPKPLSSSFSDTPTHIRHRIVLLVITLSLVTYIDRVAMSQAAPFVMKQFGLSKIQMGWVFGAFALAYAIFEIPGGWLGDRIGPHKVLLRIVLWWSFFTAATGCTWNYLSLICTRFLFGTGEAGCYPNLAKIMRSWLPANERPRAQGLMWLSSRWAGAFTPMLALVIIKAISWRFAFQSFALLGIVWACFFWRIHRNNPQDHPKVNAGELHLLSQSADVPQKGHAIPWRSFLRSPIVWCLWIQYFAVSWGWSFYITWLPTYVHEGRGTTIEQSALLSTLPLFFGGFGCLAGGMLIPVIGRRWKGNSVARSALALMGCSTAGLLLLISLHIREPLWGMVIIGVASFFNDLALAPAWEACMDLGGAHTGSLSGSMNMMGQVAGFFAPTTIGYLLAWSGQNWALTFYLSAGFYFTGSLAWFGILRNSYRSAPTSRASF